jgi:hypothetical protein
MSAASPASVPETWQPATYVVIWFPATDVPAAAEPAIDLVASALRARTDVTELTIVGYFAAGEAKEMGLKRAQSVFDHLVSKGIASARLSTRSRKGPPTVAGVRSGAVEFWITAIEGAPLAAEEQLSVDSDLLAEKITGVHDLERFATFAVHPEIPSTPAGKKALERAQEACRLCRGSWGPRGIGRYPSCACPTKDGGKVCRISSECEDRCEIPYEDSFRFEGIRCGAKLCTGAAPGVTIPLGRCTDRHDTFGCHAWMQEVSGPEGPMVEVRRACVD